MTQLAQRLQLAKTFDNVLHEIETAENKDWLWAKIVSGVTLQPTTDDVPPITEQHVWARFLSPLEPWVRAA
jgi:hypothetical protein